MLGHDAIVMTLRKTNRACQQSPQHLGDLGIGRQRLELVRANIGMQQTSRGFPAGGRSVRWRPGISNIGFKFGWPHQGVDGVTNLVYQTRSVRLTDDTGQHDITLLGEFCLQLL